MYFKCSMNINVNYQGNYGISFFLSLGSMVLTKKVKKIPQ